MVIQNMDYNNVERRNGFSVSFYPKCWDIIKLAVERGNGFVLFNLIAKDHVGFIKSLNI